MKPKRRCVYIRWMDSCGTAGWHHPGDVSRTPSSCETVGWLVRKSKTAITVALSIVADGSSGSPYGDYLTIPRAVVQEFRHIDV